MPAFQIQQGTFHRTRRLYDFALGQFFPTMIEDHRFGEIDRIGYRNFGHQEQTVITQGKALNEMFLFAGVDAGVRTPLIIYEVCRFDDKFIASKRPTE